MSNSARRVGQHIARDREVAAFLVRLEVANFSATTQVALRNQFDAGATWRDFSIRAERFDDLPRLGYVAPFALGTLGRCPSDQLA